MAKKPTTLTAILIDPFACDVTQIELPNDGDLSHYYAALSHPSMPVSIFEANRGHWLKGRDVIFIDEEGSFKDAQRYFVQIGFRAPLAGKGLIVGADARGNSISAQTPLALAKRCVAFLERDADALRLTATPWTAPEEKAHP
jgi:hypothetical protein